MIHVTREIILLYVTINIFKKPTQSMRETKKYVEENSRPFLRNQNCLSLANTFYVLTLPVTNAILIFLSINR